MNVSNHSDGRGNVNHIALLHQQLFCFGAYCFDDRVCEKFFFVEALYAFVKVHTSYLIKSAISASSQGSVSRTWKTRHCLFFLVRGEVGQIGGEDACRRRQLVVGPPFLNIILSVRTQAATPFLLTREKATMQTLQAGCSRRWMQISMQILTLGFGTVNLFSRKCLVPIGR